jgi:FRG domain
MKYRDLTPSIDRAPRSSLARAAKLALERKSIDVFRATARSFADPGEQVALVDDIVALMVLRHYSVPCRLLDWTWSPWIASYFAFDDNDSHDGGIWAFDEPRYEVVGREQWKRWPETTTDGSGDPTKWRADQTAFRLEDPPDWFICGFYEPGFPRQKAQQSVYTMTARFGRDHALKISELLGDPRRCHLYVIDKRLKPELVETLRLNHGIWTGALFPDSAGAAETAKSTAFRKASNQ